MITEEDIIKAYTRIRTIDSTIPDDILDFIKDASIKQLRISGVSNSKRFERQDLLRAYKAGAIEQKDSNLKNIDVVTLGNLQEDSQVWYERYIGELR